MVCNRISYRNFRNIAEAEMRFAPGTNLLFGSNAEGKTNALEGVSLLPEMLPGTPPLYKVRWSFPYGGHTIEIDCYPFWENEAILEVELSAPDEPIALPPEIEMLAEVTDDPNLKNRALALAMAEWENSPPPATAE